MGKEGRKKEKCVVKMIKSKYDEQTGRREGESERAGSLYEIIRRRCHERLDFNYLRRDVCASYISNEINVVIRSNRACSDKRVRIAVLHVEELNAARSRSVLRALFRSNLIRVHPVLA